jgi:hypothetical protein
LATPDQDYIKVDFSSGEEGADGHFSLVREAPPTGVKDQLESENLSASAKF